MNALINFRSIAKEVIESAPSEKARAFAEKVIGQIEARGQEWIMSHAAALHCELSADECRNMAPVSDNRLFFMQNWQMALAA